MDSKWQVDLEFLETGDIYFFYKPKSSVVKTSGINDVSRFFVILSPEKDSPSRYIVIGNKKMPQLSQDKTAWGFVQMIGGKGFSVLPKNENIVPKNLSRPAGEGIYAIVKHRYHTHLLYQLELPRIMGPVQKAFNIFKQTDYIILERQVKASPNLGDYPFSNFSPVTVAKLNARGTEILLVGVGGDFGRLGIKADPEKETLETADIFNKLKVSIQRHPFDALISGQWI
ncbi:hypothetical protein HY310_03345 [Candidatus Microgenomates bacterium]|nr:hypothetical protein [Candidatus Microgenomates bacterium]